MSETVTDLASSLRQIRGAAGLTLTAAAQQIGVTKGYLSKVESGAATPSIAVLSRLADAYGLPISDLFRDGTARSAFAVVRAGERRAINRQGTELGYIFEAVSLHKLNPRAEVFFLTLPPLPPDAPHARYRHIGEEIFHVLEGQVRFVWGDQDVLLSAGDCLQFDPSVEHRGEAVGDQPAQAFVVIIGANAMSNGANGAGTTSNGADGAGGPAHGPNALQQSQQTPSEETS